MVGHGGSSAGSYLADPTSPIPSHCASIVATSTLRVNPRLANTCSSVITRSDLWQPVLSCLTSRVLLPTQLNWQEKPNTLGERHHKGATMPDYGSYCLSTWFESIRLPYAFKMRQDYLSTSYLDQKYLPSERSETREIWIDPSNVCWDNPVSSLRHMVIFFSYLSLWKLIRMQ